MFVILLREVAALSSIAMFLAMIGLWAGVAAGA